MRSNEITVKRVDGTLVLSLVKVPLNETERGMLLLFVEAATRTDSPSVAYEIDERTGSLTTSATLPRETKDVVPTT
ncbi:hypothetical protein LCGC14_1036240 [marine sediment metagenome]|uniref:Uncharacterized protein n=1 Tax=marine sediment metagenome TaxID=412755 RepID=A0A0F9MT58_9ZZZZ